MTSSDPGVSPLRRRMVDDMRMRKFAPKTQSGYLRAVRQFAKYLGRSPDTATVEDLRNYQLHLVDHGTSPVSLNSAISGLKFFFDVTLGQPELMARMQPVRVPRKLPVVLSPEEVRRLIAAAGNLKHQTALSVAYGAGLRASEVVALKVSDIDSQRMTLRIEQGKGRRDRYAMLSPVLLIALVFRLMTSLQEFAIIFASTKGGPGDRTLSMSINAYNTAFPFYNLAGSIPMLLFLWAVIYAICFFLIGLWRKAQKISSGAV